MLAQLIISKRCYNEINAQGNWHWLEAMSVDKTIWVLPSWKCGAATYQSFEEVLHQELLAELMQYRGSQL